VVGEVKGVEEVGVRFACRGARSRGDSRSEIEVDPAALGGGLGDPEDWCLLFVLIRRERERDVYY
jgi:hypothetical protein